MKTITATITLAVFLTCCPNAMGQVPGIQDLTQNINQAASGLAQQAESPLGFKKLQMPQSLKSLDGLLDIRFKKPQLPSFGLLDKLKNIGKPQLNQTQPATTGPILAGLAKLFPPKQNTGGSFLDRLTGNMGQTNQELLRNQNELTQATQGITDHVGRMSRDVRTTTTQLFSGESVGSGMSGSLQPPLRSAREYSAGQTQSRY